MHDTTMDAMKIDLPSMKDLFQMKNTAVLNPRRSVITHALYSVTKQKIHTRVHVYIDYTYAYTLYICMLSYYARVTENCMCQKMASQITL